MFVSSTLQELVEERLGAREAITALRLSPVMFELGARPHPPWINRFNNDGNPPGVKTTGLALLPPGTPGAGISSSDLLPSGGIW